jgi:hypothetical protein
MKIRVKILLRVQTAKVELIPMNKLTLSNFVSWANISVIPTEFFHTYKFRRNDRYISHGF